MKINPRRKPATQADVNKAKQDGIEEGVDFCRVIFTLVMVDKYQWGRASLQRFAAYVNDAFESVDKGYLTKAEARRILKDDYQIGV